MQAQVDLINHKGPPIPSKSKEHEVSQILNQLQQLWTSYDSQSEQVIYEKSNQLLISWLKLCLSLKIKKPDWRVIFSRHVATIAALPKSKTALIYFEIASELLEQLSPANLLRLLIANQTNRAATLNNTIGKLKVDYIKHLNDSKSYSFAEKISINICQFLAKQKPTDLDFESVFIHYMLGLTVKDNVTLKTKTQKIILVAFESYCFYCLKNINDVPNIKLNLFMLLKNLLTMYDSQKRQKNHLLYNCFSNFISLLRTDSIQGFVTDFGQQNQVPQALAKFIDILYYLQDQDPQTFKENYIQKICLTLLQVKSADKYLSLPVGSSSTALSSKKDELFWVLSVNSSIIKFPLCDLSQYMNNFESRIEKICQQWGPNREKVLSCIFRNITVAYSQHIFQMLTKIDVNYIDRLDQSCKNALIQWRPFFQGALILISKLEKRQKYISLEVQFNQTYLFSILSQYISGNTRREQQIFSFLNNHIEPSIRKHSDFPSKYLWILNSLNNLSLTSHCKIAYDIVSSIINFTDPSKLIACPHIHYIFLCFRFAKRYSNGNKQDKKITLYVNSTIDLYIRNLYGATVQKCSKEPNNYGCHLLHCELLALIGQYYSFWKDIALDYYLDSVVKDSHNESTLINIIALVCRQTLLVVTSQLFYENQPYRQVLVNFLDFFKDVLSKKQRLTLQEKVDLVDFTFNIKTQLFSLFKKIQSQTSDLIAFIQEVVDQIDSIQLKFLHRSAEQYISHLSHVLEEDKDAPLSLVAAVAVKHIFYLINPKCQFVAQHPFQQSSQDQFDFIYDEVQSSALKLKQIKKACLIFEKKFQQMPFKVQILEFGITQYDIDLKEGDITPLCSYLHDLTYLGFLSGLDSFRTLMVSLRLSIIRKYLGMEIYLFEIHRLIFLQILSASQRHSFDAYQKQLCFQNQAQIGQKVKDVINLLSERKTSEMLFNSKRFFRLIYYMQQPTMFYFNTFKSIMSDLISQTFSFVYLPFDITQEPSVLKMSKYQRKGSMSQKWVNQCWYDDWSHLRLLIILIKRIFRQALALNELSKIKSILKFAISIHIKSGHLDELSLPIEVLMLKKKQISHLRIADSLRQVVKGEIDSSHDRKIDRVLFNKRKSLSFGGKIDSLGMSINGAFEKAGRIGLVLRDIFFFLACDHLNLNEWQKASYMMKMSIYKDSDFLNVIKQSGVLKTVEAMNQTMNKEAYFGDKIQFVSTLCKSIPHLLFRDYRAALVLKDYLASFIDHFINSQSSLRKDQNQRIDNIIIEICLLFEQFNFTIKQFWVSSSHKISLSQSNLAPCQSSINSFFFDMGKMENHYYEYIQSYIQKLKLLSYPISIIFPLGNYVFNIACHGSILLTYVLRTYFEDKVEEFHKIIKINHQILKSNNLNTEINYRKRKGFDDQLGKIVSQTDIGIIDFDLRNIPKNIIQDLLDIHPSLPKFITSQETHHLQLFIERYNIGSLEYIKQKIKAVGYLLQETNKPPNSILLYLHYKYLSFPFQNISSIRKRLSIYRVPSFRYIQKVQREKRRFNIENTKYMVDTVNNLPQTASKFRSIAQNFQRWTGVVGRVPPLEELIHLFDKDIFLYMGHGSGMQHIPSSEYVNINPNCAMLIFGCSSSAMTHENSQPHGCSFDFLMSGCPAYLGCLWNATDIDLDFVTQGMFRHGKEVDLSFLVAILKTNVTIPTLMALLWSYTVSLALFIGPDADHITLYSTYNFV